MIPKNKIEIELSIKVRELVQLYRKYNHNGTYLNISFMQTEQDRGRIHINNAFYDRDHDKPIDIKEDIYLP